MKKIALIAALISLLVSGCARYPTSPSHITGKRLVITLTVAGEINPNYFYFVAFDISGQPTPGPLPVIGAPWGNGWGTGAISSYVVYNQLQPQGGYGLYQIPPGTNLLGKVYLGPPLSSVTPPAGSNKLQFTIDLGQLATDTIPVDSIDTININFITTDILPLSPDYSGPKYYDGLGSTGTSYITISAKTNQRYSNSQNDIEPEGDCPIPDLDIIDWSVEVQGY
jgi:hypothetical protein